VRDTHDKCAYCESKITHACFGDIEHILPRAHCPPLTFEWTNLTLSCEVCNNAKSDYYEPTEPLLDPYVEDPLVHIRILGPMYISHRGSSRGEITVRRLNLNRTTLFERRKERIERLLPLLRRYDSLGPGPLKSSLLVAIRSEAAKNEEFAQTVRAFITAEYPEIDLDRA
jgi:uncharacterized protein (TIGR02646 family)